MHTDAKREDFFATFLLTFLSDSRSQLFWIGMVIRKMAFPAIRTWHVQARAKRTCNVPHAPILAMESDPFTFVLFRLSVSATLHPSLSFYLFLVLLVSPPLLNLYDGYVISPRFMCGLQIRILHYIIVIKEAGERSCQCLAHDQR